MQALVSPPPALADTLIALAPAAVHDALAPLTSWTETTDKVETVPHVSDPVARALAAARPHWAYLVAKDPEAAPDTLAWIAGTYGHRDTRILEALAGNPATSAEFLAPLVRQHALAENDEQLIVLAGAAAPDAIVTALEPWTAISAKLARALADALASRGTREQVLTCLGHTESATLHAAIGARAASGHLPATFTDVAAACAPEMYPHMLAGILTVTAPWTDEVVDWFVQHAPANEKHLRGVRAIERDRQVSTYQARRLVSLTLGKLMAPAFEDLLSHLDDATRTELISSCTVGTAANLLSVGAVFTDLTDAEIATLAGRGTIELRLETVLSRARAAGLTPPVVAALLARGDRTSTSRWLRGGFAAPLSTEALTLLAAAPGRALGGPFRRAPVTAESLVDNAGVIGALTTVELDRPGVADILDVAGARLVRSAVHGGSKEKRLAGEHLTRQLTARFGENAAAWATFAQLAPGMTGATLTEMLEATAALVTD